MRAQRRDSSGGGGERVGSIWQSITEGVSHESYNNGMTALSTKLLLSLITHMHRHTHTHTEATLTFSIHGNHIKKDIVKQIIFSPRTNVKIGGSIP